MSKIQIICSSPGLIRNGVRHAASKIYEEGHWTEAQLARFISDPAFTVRALDDDEAARGDSFDTMVAAEVNKRVGAKVAELQLSFDKAVTDAADEKMATSKTDADNTIDDLGKKLDAANTTIADLQKQFEAATAPQGDAPGKPAPKK